MMLDVAIRWSQGCADAAMEFAGRLQKEASRQAAVLARCG